MTTIETEEKKMGEDTNEDKLFVPEGAGHSRVRERVSYDPYEDHVRREEEIRRSTDKQLLRKGPDKAFWEELRSNRNTPSREKREIWGKRQELLLDLARGRLSPQEHAERVQALDKQLSKNATPETPKKTFGERWNIGKKLVDWWRSPPGKREREFGDKIENIVREPGKRLRGAAGFLRGRAAATFSGIAKASSRIETTVRGKSTPPRTSGVEAPMPGSL